DERPHARAPAEPVQVLGKRQVRHAIGVIDEERLLVLEVAPNRKQALPDVGRQAGIDERDAPIIDIAAQELDVSTAAAQYEVIGDALVVIAEIALDDIAAVPEAENEILVTEVGVVPHDVPEHRAVADL